MQEFVRRTFDSCWFCSCVISNVNCFCAVESRCDCDTDTCAKRNGRVSETQCHHWQLSVPTHAHRAHTSESSTLRRSLASLDAACFSSPMLVDVVFCEEDKSFGAIIVRTTSPVLCNHPTEIQRIIGYTNPARHSVEMKAASTYIQRLYLRLEVGFGKEQAFFEVFQAGCEL